MLAINFICIFESMGNIILEIKLSFEFLLFPFTFSSVTDYVSWYSSNIFTDFQESSVRIFYEALNM